MESCAITEAEPEVQLTVTMDVLLAALQSSSITQELTVASTESPAITPDAGKKDSKRGTRGGTMEMFNNAAFSSPSVACHTLSTAVPVKDAQRREANSTAVSVLVLEITREADPVLEINEGHCKRYCTRTVEEEASTSCKKLDILTLNVPGRPRVNVEGKKLRITGDPEITGVNSKENTAILVGYREDDSWQVATVAAETEENVNTITLDPPLRDAGIKELIRPIASTDEDGPESVH
jgi:hypothetical protein